MALAALQKSVVNDKSRGGGAALKKVALGTVIHALAAVVPANVFDEEHVAFADCGGVVAVRQGVAALLAAFEVVEGIFNAS